jgi:hypothetical protein
MSQAAPAASPAGPHPILSAAATAGGLNQLFLVLLHPLTRYPAYVTLQEADPSAGPGLA